MEKTMSQNKKLQQLFTKLDDIYQKTNYNGAYGIVTATEILHTNTRGFSNFDTSSPFERTTKTCIGSLTKQFTATALLLLEAEHKLNLNMTLAEFYPNYVYAKDITLIQMIHMTSGIPNYTDVIYEESLKKSAEQDISEQMAHFIATKTLDEDTTPLAEILEKLNAFSLDFEPGSKFAYSNTNYGLLGEIITKVTSNPFTHYFEEKIFKPLNMTATSTTSLDSQAISYRWVDGKRQRFKTGLLDSADGGMVSTLEDMMKWLQDVLKQQILSPTEWERAFTLCHNHYGFGWMTLGDWYYHGGEYLGFYAEIFIHPTTNIGKIMLYNLEAESELDQLSMDERSVWRGELVRVLQK
jgi:CubicO group peptidase (beta-lactamase class C family)